MTAHALAEGAIIEVGESVAVNGPLSITTHEKAKFSIGSQCLIAPRCDISVSDCHHILDANTGERINPTRDVFIGDHV
ncbi:MAG: hypothetical protein PGN34_05240 [Methylobacterium frigidaeris]